MKRSTKKKREPGSQQRSVLPRLAARWRRESELCVRDYKTEPHEDIRSQLMVGAAMLNKCASELESSLARQNSEVSGAGATASNEQPKSVTRQRSLD